ncbi:MAG: TIGR02281 family clan AA aspartic protease [Hyphomicrobiales bacterium]
MNFHQHGKPGPGPWGSPPAPKPRFGRRLFIVAGTVILAVLCLFWAFPPALGRDWNQIAFVQYALILTMLLTSLAASRRPLSRVAGELVIWAMLALLLVAAYGYRYELRDVGERVLGELLPTRGQQSAGGIMTFTRAADGQFWIDAEVDGRPVRFLVDTGASGVALTREDAARLGFSPASLSFTQIFETANGTTRGAPVELERIRIGPIEFTNVPASVAEGELGQSLLGMHLLEKLSGIEIRNDKLIIRQ